MSRSPKIEDPTRLLPNIRGLLKARGLTQRDLGAAIHLGQAAVSTRLTGRVDLTVREVDRIADFLGVGPYDLVYADLSDASEAER